jgi:hypothetical protein
VVDMEAAGTVDAKEEDEEVDLAAVGLAEVV